MPFNISSFDLKTIWKFIYWLTTFHLWSDWKVVYNVDWLQHFVFPWLLLNSLHIVNIWKYCLHSFGHFAYALHQALIMYIHTRSKIGYECTCRCHSIWQCQASHWHYSDVIMSTMVYQITSLMIVYSTVHPGTEQRKHQSSASLAFVRGIHRSPVNSPHKGPVMRKMFPFDDIIMAGSIYMSWWLGDSKAMETDLMHDFILAECPTTKDILIDT